MSGTAAIVTRDEALEPKLAIPFGVGMGLTLDESALLLELEDVYWSEEGILSVQITLAVTAMLGALALGLRFLRRGEQVVLEARVRVAPWRPESPAPRAPDPGPQSPARRRRNRPPHPRYTGPVPPGGWQQPVQPSAPVAIGGQLASWGSRLGAYADRRARAARARR